MIKRGFRAALILFLITCLTSTTIALGDGCVVRRPTNTPSWDYSEEDNQVCFISHKDGLETMVLSVDVSEGEDDLVWIFPVPAIPESVYIDVTKGLPILKGVNVGETSKKVIHLAVANARNTVFIPFPDDVPRSGRVYSMGLEAISGVNELDSEEVTIHKLVNKLGLSVLLLDADSSTALDVFLTENGVELPAGAQSVIDEYIGEDYCFVVSWVNDLGMTRVGSLAISLRFPTASPYFPLRLTSVYDDLEIPITVYVRGHWIPNLYQGISGYSDVDYYTRTTIDYPDSRYGLADTQYTRLSINSPSQQFSDDIWFKKGITLTGWVSKLILENQFITWLMTEFLLFGAASLIASITVLGWDISKPKYFLLGSFNIFSVIVLGLGYLLVTARKHDDPIMSAPYSGELLGRQGYRVPVRGLVFDARVLVYLVLFTVLMLILSVILEGAAIALL